MTTKPSTLAQYLAGLSSEQRATIEQMRDAIISSAPQAKAVFSYHMPGFELDGEPLAWVAAWKHHFSLYPLTKSMLDAHGAALEQYEISKGTLRFPASKAVPHALIRKLIRTRVAESEREKPAKAMKPAKKKARTAR